MGAKILPSWLPAQGGNLFQEIKAVCREAESAGKKLIKLSIGQPLGPALLAARKEAERRVMSDEDCWHEYQDNLFLPFSGWAERFCRQHVISEFPSGLDFMPIPGSKPMLGLVPLACGTHRKLNKVMSMTSPGYPVPKTWCEYLRIPHSPFVTNPENHFLPEVEDLSAATNLWMFNLPHNPSGQIATREYWRKVCAYAEKNGIRVFNDAAYILLSHAPESCALADVAPEFPGLSWMEAYSSSKEIGNGTGWRVGAVVGSPDFVGDLRTIKGDTDSGFFAPAAAGALFALENCHEEIKGIREKYEHRLALLSQIVGESGMKISLDPKAGFFLLCQAPQYAFGEKMKDAKEFNYAMIKNTGIVGVHFHPYIRYAVCGPVEGWHEQIMEGFASARVEYTN